ncbi:MAG: asparagine synthetase B family protein [bacterium]
MKGICSRHPLDPQWIKRQGFEGIFPGLWIADDPFTKRHQSIVGAEGKKYNLMIRGECDASRMESIRDVTDALSALKGRWLILLYTESSPQDNAPEIRLISDRLGSHRIYYAFDADTLIWGTELSGLLDLKRGLGREIALDLHALNGYLHFLHQPISRSILQGVSILPPASCLVMSKGDLRISKYWSPEFEPRIESEERAVSEIRQMFDAIGLRGLSSDEKTGLFLSGGLDSSILAGIYQEKGRDLQTYTVGFEGADDEIEAARAVAKHFKTRHREIILRPEDISALLREVTQYLGFPSGNPSGLAIYSVARMAGEEGVERLVSGLGSDEVFAGHTKHILARYWPVAKPCLSVIWRIFSPFASKRSDHLLGRPQRISDYLDLYTFFKQDQLNRLLLPGYRSQKNGFYSDLHRDRFREEQFLTDIFAWLSDDLLPMITTLVFSQGLRLDMPFCGDDFLDCAARIPLEMKVKGEKGKWVLREASQGLVPDWVLKKKRQGFTLPIGRWFRGPLKGMLSDYLDRDIIQKRGIFNPIEIQRLIRAHLEEKADLSLQIWGLITLEAWQRIFIDPHE